MIVMVFGMVMTTAGVVLVALIGFTGLVTAIIGAAITAGGGLSILIDHRHPRYQESANDSNEGPLPLVTVVSDAATENDEFGRTRYVDALADIAVRADTPLVVALHGSWGSGKTSLMYQIRRRLEPDHDGTQSGYGEKPRARTIWFDPWMHQFDQAPAIALLHATTEQLGLTTSEEAKETLKKIALALAEDIRIPYLGLHLGKIATIRSEVANDEFRRREQQARLRDHFHRILNLAGAPSTRLVFFIDDLDRCQPKLTVEVLEALKLYLDFPGCVYILGVDREPLEAAIKSEYENLRITESSYLDKIVQLPFSLPAISETAMRQFVTDRIPSELQECTEILVAAGADDPRQVKRILNSLILNHTLVPPSLGADYLPRILAALILIQNLAPELYRQLRLNPSSMHELFSGASGTQPANLPVANTDGSLAAADVEAQVPPASGQASTQGTSLWTEYISAKPRLAAALRLVNIPADLDLQSYFTLTATIAAPASTQAAQPEAQALSFSGPKGLTDFVRVNLDELDSVVSSSRAALRDVLELRTRETSMPRPPVSDSQFKDELSRLAIVGYRIFDTLFRALSPSESDRLSSMIRGPQVIPIGRTTFSTKTIPAATLYDYPIDTAHSLEDYNLCTAFSDALMEQSDLTKIPCWDGKCPTWADRQSICPSGFWGFRHALGHLPQAAPADANPITQVSYEESPDIVVAFDRSLMLAVEHIQRLIQSCPSWPTSHWWQAEDRASLMRSLRDSEPHLIYIFSRGREADGFPAIMLADDTPIYPTDLRSDLQGSTWNKSRPIIIMNSGFEGDGMAQYATGFIANNASGVVGLDIAILQQDAASFAENLVVRLVQGQEIGWAVRDSRLELLKIRSPFGLAYTPFVSPDLRLERKPDAE